MKEHHNASSWIRLSDLMTALMMVFLLIAIIYVSEVQEKREEENKLITEYNQSKKDIHDELNSAFKDKFQEWDMVLDDDLSIKFNNPDVLFERFDANLTDKYKRVLDEFIPTYLSIINKTEYREDIKEVRIEGHTADYDNRYMDSIRLSQDRSNSVLSYIFDSEYFKNLGYNDKIQLQFWLTSNGLGYGRAIDDDGTFVIDSRNGISAKSRRVEFKIVTSSESLVETLIRNYQIIQE